MKSPYSIDILKNALIGLACVDNLNLIGENVLKQQLPDENASM